MDRSRSVCFIVLCLALIASHISCFQITPNGKSVTKSRGLLVLSTANEEAITSPFEEGVKTDATETLPLTWDNVEKILDEMRPYLMSDGGNVRISEIDGPVVKLELEGACGTCPSSSMTMKMGLERRLKEAIPEIQEVIQDLPEGPELCADEVESVLDGVRPFLKVAGGSINIVDLKGVGGLQPTVVLKMDGSSASLSSVKMEIVQRVQRHFMIPNLRVEYDEPKRDDDDDIFDRPGFGSGRRNRR
mmetsp:Transcript_16550/g.25050  ORF Transcript_16550/g.25050 Transcript_16550/m.25050 type:complete len:246 (-) Transcript_16550:240-977(-)